MTLLLRRIERRLLATQHITPKTMKDFQSYFCYWITNAPYDFVAVSLLLLEKNPWLRPLFKPYGGIDDVESLRIGMLSEYLEKTVCNDTSYQLQILHAVLNEVRAYMLQNNLQQELTTLLKRLNRINPRFLGDIEKTYVRIDPLTHPEEAFDMMLAIAADATSENDIIEEIFEESACTQLQERQQNHPGLVRSISPALDRPKSTLNGQFQQLKYAAQSRKFQAMVQLALFYRQHTMAVSKDPRLLFDKKTNQHNGHIDCHDIYWLMRAFEKNPSPRIKNELSKTLNKKMNKMLVLGPAFSLEAKKWHNQQIQFNNNPKQFISRRLNFFKYAAKADYKNAVAKGDLEKAAKHLANVFHNSIYNNQTGEQLQIITEYLVETSDPFLEKINLNDPEFTDVEKQALHHIRRIQTPTPWEKVRLTIENVLESYSRFPNCMILIKQIHADLTHCSSTPDLSPEEERFSYALLEKSESLSEFHHVDEIKALLLKLWEILNLEFDVLSHKPISTSLQKHWPGIFPEIAGNDTLSYYRNFRRYELPVPQSIIMSY